MAGRRSRSISAGASTVLALLAASLGWAESNGAARPTRSSPPPTITVFAAASLTDVLGSLGQLYSNETGQHVKFSFAGTPILARQVDAGARVDLFVSADEAWMDWLEQRGRLVPGSRVVLAGNRLVLVAPRASAITLAIESGMPLNAALGSDGRLAVAEPDAVPAGRYAREALSHLGVWDGVQKRLARAENVRAALMFVARSEVPLGIVYATDAAVERRVRVVGEFPADSHAPILYLAALTGGTAGARFLQFLRGAPAAEAFRRAGFMAPPAAAASAASGTHANR